MRWAWRFLDRDVVVVEDIVEVVVVALLELIMVAAVVEVIMVLVELVRQA